MENTNLKKLTELLDELFNSLDKVIDTPTEEMDEELKIKIEEFKKKYHQR